MTPEQKVDALLIALLRIIESAYVAIADPPSATTVSTQAVDRARRLIKQIAPETLSHKSDN